MKKRFLLVMACMCLLSGCGSQEGNTYDTPETQTGVITNAPDATKEPEKNSAPKIEDTFLANKEAVGENGVAYELPGVEMGDASQSKIFRYGNDLLVTYSYFEQSTGDDITCVSLIGIETGKIINETKITGVSNVSIQIIDDNIYALDSGSGKSYVLNNKLETIKEYSFSEPSYYFDEKGENVVLFTSNDGIIVRNLETEKETVILENSKNVITFNLMGNNAGFTYVDATTRKKHAAYVDLKTLEVVEGNIPYAMWNTSCSDDTWLCSINDKDCTYMISNDGSQMMFNTELFATLAMCPETTNIIKINSDYETNIMNAKLYDTNGKFISEFEAKDTMYFNIEAPIWYEEYQGYIFVVAGEDGYDKLMFWDVSQKVEGEDLELYPAEEFRAVKEGGAVSSDYYKRAKELGEKYGVQIRIADQCDTDYDMYTTIQHTEEKDIETALNYLEDCFAIYPEGFFEQLKAGEYSGVEINLMGDMTIKEGDVDPIGFIECQNGKYVMGIDIRPYEVVSQTTEQIFYHEVSHMIEEKLLRESNYIENGFSDDTWASFNPEGFVYTEDTEDGISMYGKYYYAFIDEYGTSNVREDRARIMEYAAYDLWDEMEVDKIVKDKYNYYCDSIRKGFDTTGWPERTFWEETDWRE